MHSHAYSELAFVLPVREKILRRQVYDENWQRLDFKTEISGAVSISSFQIPTGFKPKIVLVNENQNMNLAALQGSIVVNKIGTFSIPSVDFLALNLLKYIY